jgi:hypothetical protein
MPAPKTKKFTPEIDAKLYDELIAVARAEWANQAACS